MGKKGEDAVTAAVRASLICSTFIAAGALLTALVPELSAPIIAKVFLIALLQQQTDRHFDRAIRENDPRQKPPS
jgi:hypothetical protein